MQYILKIDCPDQKGLVHAVSGQLYHSDLNIVENEEFVDKDSKHFFMRSEVEGKLEKRKMLKELKAELPKDARVELLEKRKKNIVIFVSKEYHCLGDLLVRNHFGELLANVRAVISNHQMLGEFVKRFGIPFHYIPSENIEREQHEERLLTVVKAFKPEFIVLAKYMRIFTANFISKFPNKIVNIHHSFLPAFIGARPYAQAYSRGVKMIGATAHLVNENLDEGPIIMQDVIQTNHKMDAKAMARAGRDVEKIVLSNALKLVFDNRVFVHNNKTIIL